MRYWQHNEDGRLLKVDVQMAPSKWTEITKEQYEEAMEYAKTLSVTPDVRDSERPSLQNSGM